MSRSGYHDDVERWDLIRWRGQVASAIRGKRGQKFLLEMWNAMNGLTVRRLMAEELERNGEVCALGSVGAARGMDMSQIDPEDYDAVAAAFGIPHQLAQEIMYINDEGAWSETPEARFTRVQKWIEAKLHAVPVSE